MAFRQVLDNDTNMKSDLLLHLLPCENAGHGTNNLCRIGTFNLNTKLLGCFTIQSCRE